MHKEKSTITEAVRSVMPTSTLNMLGRPLNEAEARTVAERQATTLLELLGITKPSVEIERILELSDIEVEVLPNLPLSGASDWVNDHWHILINADDSLWRCRATLAHEYKHILDDPFRDQLYPKWPRGSKTPAALAERVCDYFAGCVLVPRHWLYKAWDAGVRSPAALATHFDVSESLIEVRIDQTKVRQRPANSRHRWQRPLHQSYQRRTAKPAKPAKQLTEGEKHDYYDLLLPIPCQAV